MLRLKAVDDVVRFRVRGSSFHNISFYLLYVFMCSETLSQRSLSWLNMVNAYSLYIFLIQSFYFASDSRCSLHTARLSQLSALSCASWSTSHANVMQQTNSEVRNRKTCHLRLHSCPCLLSFWWHGDITISIST